MRWNLHELTVEGSSNNRDLMAAWQQSFRSRPQTSAEPQITLNLDIVDQPPARPTGEPQFTQGDLLSYYLNDNQITVHFPKYGQLYLNSADATTSGKLLPATLTTYGVLEDMVAISLTAHMRRRGYFLIHAFAAALNGQAVLIVGGIGAGKTTTGLSLLNAGWQLLSNDSPIVAAGGQILSYPGVLAAYPETFARFERTADLAQQQPIQSGRQKLLISAESIFPDIWLDQAPIAAIVFPQIESRSDHKLEQLSQPDALRQLLPHAIEQWDRAMIPKHLGILRQLTDAAPAYTLHLSPDVPAIPDKIKSILPKSAHQAHPDL